MEYLVVICGCLGAWLLVAGPVYQAALELQEEAIDREAMSRVAAGVPQPPKLSSWWWLLPPVAYVKQRRAGDAYRRAVMAQLAPEQMEAMIAFMNKATGWLLVAIGALLIGVKETWELCELFHFSAAIFWVLIVLAIVICVGHTVARLRGTERVLKKDEDAAANIRRTRSASS